MNVIVWVIGILFLLGVFYFVVVKKGNLSFWRKAAKNPDLVFKLLSEDDAWVIGDENKDLVDTKLDGPFLLYVPTVGKTVKFYGKAGEYEESQKRIEELLK